MAKAIPRIGSRRNGRIGSRKSARRSEVVRAVIVRTCKELKRDNGMIIRYGNRTSNLFLYPRKSISIFHSPIVDPKISTIQ